MEIDILKNSKNELELQVGNLTIAELLRVYLNKDSDVTFSAWKRNHPSEKPVVKVETKEKVAKKAVNQAISSIIKDLESVEKAFGNMK